MRSLRLLFSIAVGALVLSRAPLAQTSTQVATLVPIGSVWDKSLKQMADEFKQATGGRYEMTVYAGGTQGDEPTVLRKMRLDALQAAAFTHTGPGVTDTPFHV